MRDLTRKKQSAHKSALKTQASPGGIFSGQRNEVRSIIRRVPLEAEAPTEIIPQLRVSTPGDMREQAAERMAQRAMAMTSPSSTCQRATHCGLQTGGTAAKKNDGAFVTLMGQEGDRSGKEDGQPLTDSIRSYYERRLGHDFSHVRLHTGPIAARAAHSLRARAYTQGQHIVFGAGQYAPHSVAGRRLLAHELAHVVQQSGLNDDVIYRHNGGSEQSTAPHIAFRGHYTFYLPHLADGGRENGFVAQFTIIDDATNTVSVKVLYQATRHLREFSFPMSRDRNLNPRLLQHDVNTAVFDLDGDGNGDLEILLLANNQTQGMRVYVTRPGQTVGTYIIPPPERRIVPGRGYEMGTLPNGRRYYLQPWTYHLPNGPWYVDEDGRGVNPALEFRAAAILDAMARAYLYSYAALLTIGLGAAVLPALPGSAVVAAGVVRGAGAIRWLFTGTRLIAGGTTAAANLATQAMEHGAQWERYNWGSVGFDYIMGAVSYSVAKAVIARWPAPLFSREIGNLSTWVNFGKQQAVIALYGTFVGAVRAQVSNTQTGATVAAQHAEGLLQMVKSVGLQSFLNSPLGRRLLPAGFEDPRVAFISRLLTFITKLAVREVFDVVPETSPRQE